MYRQVNLDKQMQQINIVSLQTQKISQVSNLPKNRQEITYK
jgi:hypothetical protein